MSTLFPTERCGRPCWGGGGGGGGGGGRGRGGALSIPVVCIFNFFIRYPRISCLNAPYPVNFRPKYSVYPYNFLPKYPVSTKPLIGPLVKLSNCKMNCVTFQCVIPAFSLHDGKTCGVTKPGGKRAVDQAMEMCSKQLLDKDFKEELIRNLNVLRKSNILCDITLRVEEKDFAAHRCVLTAASPYIRALFTTDFKENENNLVELKDVKYAALSEVLQFMYTGEAKADSSNAQDLIMLADYLILPSLRSKVSEFLEGTISSSNCLALESFASQFNCESLKEAAVTYTVKNFVAVVNSDDFKALDFDKVKSLISRDDIIVPQEEEVYEAVILWVKHDLLSRECLFPELLKYVRAYSMSKYTLREILGKEELVVKSPACTSILLEGLDAFLFPDSIQALMQMPRLCLKSKEPVVVLTGGHSIMLFRP